MRSLLVIGGVGVVGENKRSNFLYFISTGRNTYLSNYQINLTLGPIYCLVQILEPGLLENTEKLDDNQQKLID